MIVVSRSSALAVPATAWASSTAFAVSAERMRRSASPAPASSLTGTGAPETAIIVMAECRRQKVVTEQTRALERRVAVEVKKAREIQLPGQADCSDDSTISGFAW